jgi:leader peptidase (prepilin peptidase)/N-methyltransferase
MSSPDLGAQSELASNRWLIEIANSYRTAALEKRLAVGLIGIAAIIASIVTAPGAIGVLGAGLAVLMLTIAIIDARCFVIPDMLSGAAFFLGIAHAAVGDPSAVGTAVAFAIIRGAVLASILLSIRHAYRRIRSCEGLGLGDVKLAGAAGAWLDWSVMPIAIEIAACAALAFYLVNHFAFNRTIHATSRLPFGLFFAPTIWACWIFQTGLFGLF